MGINSFINFYKLINSYEKSLIVYKVANNVKNFCKEEDYRVTVLSKEEQCCRAKTKGRSRHDEGTRIRN